MLSYKADCLYSARFYNAKLRKCLTGEKFRDRVVAEPSYNLFHSYIIEEA